MKNIKKTHSYQDPSLSAHIHTLHGQVNNIPKLKYSLACISNTLSYNNSNRHYDIQGLSEQKNFKQFVNLLINNQDQKIMEQSLSILNILLNQGNDLNLRQESQIMHSLTYVKFNNCADKNFISDRLVQEILNLTYKLKTKNQLSSFIANLMSQKMSALQAKKFIKQLRKQQLKNISIADLIKIGSKFKTNVSLMNQILNLIYQKIFSRRDLPDIKKLCQFLPKIVQQNIDEETISYKCLQIFKLIQNGNLQFDPIISKYLNSLLRYKKQLLMPLKRQFIRTDQDFSRILDYGTQFQLYHLLIIDYLLKNGYKNGKQSWINVLSANSSQRNLKLKNICIKIGQQQQGLQKLKVTKISQAQESPFIKYLPIQALINAESILKKVIQEPSISNCLYVIKNLSIYSHFSELLLTIHKISLKQKQFHLVQQIQKVVAQGFNEQFVYNQIKNITKVKHKIVLKGQLFFIWMPVLMKSQKLIKSTQNQLAEIMSYEAIQIEQKFYVIQFLLQNQMEKVVTKFLLYLNRQLESINSLQQESRKYGQNVFSQIKYYLKKWVPNFKNNKQVINFYSHKLLFHLQRTAELLFSKVVQFKSQSITTLLFQLQKWDFYGQTWRQPYRWILTALQQISQQNSIFTLDCLQIFQMCIQNIKQNEIPSIARDRFIKSVKKNWSKFQSQHLFAIQRIMEILWPDHQYPIIQSIQPIKSVTQLIQEQSKFNKKNQYFFQSQHPTSNYLNNIQMSHFFGIISQQQFVRHILHLYDKKYNEVKRFTQKNVISLMNFIIWIYQYSQEDMDKGFSQMILAFLGYKSEGVNQISSYNIRKKCIQIVAGVSHSINLLRLPIKELLQTYIGAANIMKNINQIVQTIIQSKASFISQLSLEKIIQSMMISLITIEDLQLAQQYINFIESVCYIQNSKYSVQFQNSLEILYQIIKVQYKTIDKYRRNLVLFVLDILKHYQFQIETKLLWFLMNKYFIEEDIQISILSTLTGNLNSDENKGKFKLQFSNQKLLIRLIMHHNENNQIIQNVQLILNNSIKQKPPIKGQQKQTNKKSTLSVIIQACQNVFIQSFKKQQYSKCQQILGQIRNPLLIILNKNQLQCFFKNPNLVDFGNLLNFLIKNPSTRNQVLAVQQFYIKRQSTSFILKLAQNFAWNQHNLQKIKLKHFNQEHLKFQFETNILQSIVKQSVSSLFSRQNIKKSIIQVLKSIKSQKSQIQLISFYCKTVNQTQQKILCQIINELKLQEGIQYMRFRLPYKIANISEGPVDLLLYHLYVHIQNVNFMQSPQLQNQERYIKDVVSLTCTHQIQKYLSHASMFFINLGNALLTSAGNKFQNLINSKIILREIIQICYRYLTIFENGNSSGNIKGVQIKISDCLAILSTYLFMYKNGQNINTVITTKILSSIQSKCSQNEILRQCFDLIKAIIAGQYENRDKRTYLENKVDLKDERKQNKQQTQIMESPQNKNSSSTSNSVNKAQLNVVFPKQYEQDLSLTQTQQQQQINDAFNKGKQLQQYLSVVPSKIKALNAKNEKAKSTDINQNENLTNNKQNQSSSFNYQKLGLDQQNLIRPKQQNFDLNKFYEVSNSQTTAKVLITQQQRKENLIAIRAKQNEQVSIATLKQHSKFITILNDCSTLNKQQIQQLLKSIDNITITVNQHHYYVKKLIELEVPFKLIKLYKCKDRFIPKQLSYLADLFENKLLKLHHAMSYKKQKKTIIFDDQLTISFLKLILKKSINNQKPSDTNLIVIQIIQYCLKSIDAFFKQGLLSILIQLIKLDINHQQVLKFFCKIQLSKHLIFQIYQRGLLNKLVQVFNNKSQNIPNSIFNLWIKLAGKICTSFSIQQKYVQKNINKLVWEKYSNFLIKDLQSSSNISYFFAFLVKKNPSVFQYIIENQILQKLLSSLQNENTQELYMLFYFVALQNQSALEYCFRIKYHLHLIQKLSKYKGQKALSKYFYKSLGQIMSNKHHQSLFFKEQIVQKLIRSYQNKPEPSIFQCLLDFIITLDNDKQFEQLKKQQFWSCLSLFQYKLSSEATYAYILQIFLVMIKKGRIKQFNTPEIRGKVTLKAQFSINLQGKQLALRFITALSLKTKQCYITQRCIRLLSSIVGFKVTSNQLDIIQDILDVDGMIENYQFLTFCNQYEIIQTICNRFKSFNEKELLSAIKILNILGTQYRNNKIIRDKLLMPIMEILAQSTYQSNPLSQGLEEWLFKLILLIVSFRQNNEVVQKLQLGKFMITKLQKIIQGPLMARKSILQQYVSIVQLSRQNNMIPLKQLQIILNSISKSKIDQQISKVSEIKQNLQGSVTSQTNEIINKMIQGLKVRMYKNDGSSSQLILFLTDDKLQLNCVTQKREPIKQKWRLALNEISQIKEYSDQVQYKSSAFYRSAGIFNTAPDRKFCLSVKSKTNEFNILFFSKQIKQTWKGYIQFAIQYSKKLLKQFK